MELRHLRYFIMLADELHFGKAAKRLFISQPPLSRQIKELEGELGATLLLRNNKRVALTPAGEYFLKEAQEILLKLESVKHHTNQIHHCLAGEIKLGYISSVDKTKLGLLIQRIQKKHPYVQTKLFELPTEKQISALENRKLDIGIIRAPNPSYRLQTEKLYDDGFCLALPKKVDLPEDLSSLSDFPFIFYYANYAPVYHNQMLAFCAQLGFLPSFQHECNNISSILELVHLNAGISIVPKSVQSQYKHLDISFFNVENLTIKTEILLVSPRQQEHPIIPYVSQYIVDIFKK